MVMDTHDLIQQVARPRQIAANYALMARSLRVDQRKAAKMGATTAAAKLRWYADFVERAAVAEFNDPEWR